jgi:hypothetical protein
MVKLRLAGAFAATSPTRQPKFAICLQYHSRSAARSYFVKAIEMSPNRNLFCGAGDPAAVADAFGDAAGART